MQGLFPRKRREIFKTVPTESASQARQRFKCP